MQMISMSGSRENEVQNSAVPGSLSVSTTTYHPSLITIFQKLRWICFSSYIDGVAVLTDTIGAIAIAAIIVKRERHLTWTAGAAHFHFHKQKR